MKNSFISEFNKIRLEDVFNFIKVGFLNTCFGYVVYATFLLIGLPYAESLFISTVFGVIFNYITFGKFVFRQSLYPKVFMKFIFAYGFVFLFNWSILWLITSSTKIGPYFGQLVCIPLVVFLNWCVLNFWVYKKGIKF